MRPDPCFDREIGALRQTVSRTRSAANRILWRHAMQRRSTAIARILRTLSILIVAPGVGRAKAPNGWIVTAMGVDGGSQVLLEVMTATTGHTIAELGMPIPIRVHRRELVNLPLLQQLQQAGSVTVELAEARL